MANFFSIIKSIGDYVKLQQQTAQTTLNNIETERKLKELKAKKLTPAVNTLKTLVGDIKIPQVISPSFAQTYSQPPTTLAPKTPEQTQQDWKDFAGLAQIVPAAVAKTAVSLGTTPSTITQGYAPDPTKVPRWLQPIVGSDKISSYAYDTGEAIKNGTPPVVAVLMNGGQAIIDMTITGQLVQVGSKLLTNEASQVASWSTLGMPKDLKAARVEAIKLQQIAFANDPVKSKLVGAAYNNLARQGIPIRLPAPLKFMQDAAEALNTPVEKLFIPKEGTPYINIKGLLPGKAIIGKPQPSMGLSIQPVEDVGGVKPTVSGVTEVPKTYYHGGVPYNPKLITKDGISITDSKITAEGWQKSNMGSGNRVLPKDKIINELFIDPKAKIMPSSEIPKNLYYIDNINGAMPTESYIEIVKYAKDKGYDGVNLDIFGENEIRITNPDVLKTKSQLYNQTTKVGGVPEVPMQTIEEKAFDLTMKNGGVTISLNGDIPTEGFSYSPSKLTEYRVPKTEFQLSNLDTFVSKNLKDLEKPGNYLGAWEEKGEIFIDVSRVEPDFNKAMKGASLSEQLAIFDLGKFEGHNLADYKNVNDVFYNKGMIAKSETVPEYAVSKEGSQKRLVMEKSKDLLHSLNTTDITNSESTDLFNAMENPEKYPLTPGLVTKGGNNIITQAQELNTFLSEEKTTRGLLKNSINDDVYLKTILENLDGTPASAEKLARLKNATDESFREQLIYKQPTNKVINEPRKYATADERDLVLKDFGLKTKRDFVTSMKANIDLTAQLTARKDFQDSLRGLAKSGLRGDIVEVYDPVDVREFVSKQRQIFVDKKDAILKDLRTKKILADNDYKYLKGKTMLRFEEAKDFERSVIDYGDFEVSKLKITDEIKNAFQVLKEDVQLTIDRLRKETYTAKKEISIISETEITKAKDAMLSKVQDYYEKIVTDRGRMIDEGKRDLGELMTNGQALRGLMVSENDFTAVKELFKEVPVNSLEDAAKTLKLMQATLDIFQIPQALRGAIRLNGLKGVARWWKAVTGSGIKNLTIQDVVDASEFMRIGRYQDFDIDIWDKISSNFNRDSKFTKIVRGISEKVPGIGKALSPVKKLENYQWETVMIPMKVNVWKDMVEAYKIKFPNMSLREIQVTVGRAVDDAFGGQNYRRLLARNPKLFNNKVQQISNMFIFARDYLVTSLRTLGRETLGQFKKGVEGDINRKGLARKILYGLGIANVISLLLNGRTTFENDDPNQWYKIQVDALTDEKGNPYYIDLMGNWGQSWNLINRPVSYFAGKMSGLGQLALSGLSGDGLDFQGLNPVPFGWRNLTSSVLSYLVQGKAQFGVPSDLKAGAITTLSEAFGLQGTFSGGTSKTSSVAKMIEKGYLQPIDLWNWITGRPMQTIKKSTGGGIIDYTNSNNGGITDYTKSTVGGIKDYTK